MNDNIGYVCIGCASVSGTHTQRDLPNQVIQNSPRRGFRILGIRELLVEYQSFELIRKLADFIEVNSYLETAEQDMQSIVRSIRRGCHDFRICGLITLRLPVPAPAARSTLASCGPSGRPSAGIAPGRRTLPA